MEGILFNVVDLRRKIGVDFALNQNFNGNSFNLFAILLASLATCVDKKVSDLRRCPFMLLNTMSKDKG